MELLTASDFVVTVSLAVLLSILVAKLVSMAMASDPNTHEPVIALQQDRLTVQKAQSEKRVEFIGPIQVSTNVETEQNRGPEQEQEQEQQEEDMVELDAVTPEDIAVEFDVSEVGLLREDEVVTEKNEESEQQRKTEDCEEQRKTEEINVETSGVKETEDLMEQGKTEETTIEEKGVMKESEKQRKTENIEDHKEQGKAEETTIEEKGVKEIEKQRKTENIEDHEQGKTEETTIEVKGVKERNDDDDDDDWEGIERSELEKMFMMATEFVVGGDGDGLGSDHLQMELYGLHKIATEGPCRESQPMPLKLNARAKWNAWQKLGNMSPEVAMERYIDILSNEVPGWMKDSSSAGMSENEHKGSEVSESVAPDLSTSLSHQQMIIPERELEQESGAKEHSTVKETDLENNVRL